MHLEMGKLFKQNRGSYFSEKNKTFKMSHSRKIQTINKKEMKVSEGGTKRIWLSKCQ